MRKYLFFLSSVLSVPAVSGPVAAAEAPAAAGEEGAASDTAITVLATGSRIAIDQTGQSVSVVGLEEIASVQGPDLTRVFERLPGVTINRYGDMGGLTSVRVRGAEADQLLVLIDGVRVNDPAVTGGGYDFGGLLSGGVERVDLLRGSNSVIWGSQAIGGVLAMTSRDLNGVDGSVEYGARDSVTVDGAAGLVRDGYALALNGGYARTDGISSAASGDEADGFRQWRAGVRGRVDLAPGLSASVVARYADSRTDLDGYPAPDYIFVDTPEYQTVREASGRAALNYQGGALTVQGGAALSDTRRAYFDAPGDAANFQSKGRSERLDMSGVLTLPAGFRVNFGADSEWTRFSTTYDSQKSAQLSSGHVLLGYGAGPLNLAAGVRLDDHSRFGSEWTFGANGSLAIAEGWRVRASYGEGFKAPTLYQLFSNYGNVSLAPERSHSADVALEKGDRNAPLHFAVTLFRRDTRDMIDFISCRGRTTGICTNRPWGTYDNIGKTRADGVEVELGAAMGENLRAQAVYTYVKSTNRTAGDIRNGNDLARRPRHALTVSADWSSPLAGLALGADLRLVGDSFDDSYNFTRLDGYHLVTVRASLPVTAHVELFGRVENLFDTQYQTTAGYGTPGRSAYIGARARF